MPILLTCHYTLYLIYYVLPLDRVSLFGCYATKHARGKSVNGILWNAISLKSTDRVKSKVAHLVWIVGFLLTIVLQIGLNRLL